MTTSAWPDTCVSLEALRGVGRYQVISVADYEALVGDARALIAISSSAPISTLADERHGYVVVEIASCQVEERL